LLSEQIPQNYLPRVSRVGGWSMGMELQRLRVPIALALKWRALADRKVSHLEDMHKSGRWNCYYSEEQLASAIEDAQARARAVGQCCSARTWSR
jgi:hypothetical protein